MKLVFSCLILSFVFNFTFGLMLNKIKIIGNNHTETKTILEIASELKEGKEYEEENLKRIASRIEERLKNTCWFFGANVYIVESNAGEKYRNVIIEVEEGYLYRFYGGNAYGGFGMDNVFGGGEGYRIEVGLNRQNLKLEKLFAPYHIKLSANAGNVNSIIYSHDNREIKVQSIGVRPVIYYLINWDFSVYLNGEYSRNFDTSYNFLFDSYFTGCGIVFDKRNNNALPSKGYYTGLDLKYIDFKYMRITFDGRVFLPIFDKLSFAIRFIYSTEDRNVPYYYRLNILGIDGVRNIYPNSLGSSIVQANLELRWRFYNFKLFSLVDTIFEATIFSDVGKAFDDFFPKEFETYSFAYGGGLRIFFDNPVFLPLRFEVGFNKNFDPLFYFDISYPF